MLTKTYKFPAEVGTILDRVMRMAWTGLAALGGEKIVNEYVLYHLCVVLKNRFRVTCKNETKTGPLDYDALASLEHVIDTFGTDNVEEFFDLLGNEDYPTYRIIGYENVDGYTNVSVELE